MSTEVNATVEVDKKFRLTIFQDEDSSYLDPNEEDNLFRLHSFNRRHMSYSDPDTLLGCSHTDEDGEECGWGSSMHTDEDGNLEELIGHEYEGPEGYLLSYFEHGLCKWFLASPSNRSMPDFQWDGVMYAGFLEVVVPDDEREWWDGRPEEEKRDAAASFCAYYTSWVNGEVYGYQLERIGGETCNLGHFHEESQVDNSCFGFIGFDYFQQEVRLATGWMGAMEENTEVVDKAYGSAAYGDFFTGHHWVGSFRTDNSDPVHCEECSLYPKPGGEEWDSKCPRKQWEEKREERRAQR